MQTVKIGFVASTWESWDGSDYSGRLQWAKAMRKRCLDVMAKVPGLEIVVPDEELTEFGCVGTVEEGMKVAELFKKEEIKGMIVGNMNFGFETALNPILSTIDRDMPILHFCTKSGPYSPQGNRATDTWCGQFMTCSAMKRRGFKFEHVITCDPEEPIFFEKLEIFTRAVNAISRFKGARILQIGTRPTGFESEFCNEQLMMKKFRQTLVPVDLATAYETLDAITADDPRVQEIIKDIVGGADEIIKETHDYDGSLVNQARFELTIKTLMEKFHCDAVASSCWETLQHKYGIAACSTFSRLNNQGIITACEVDVMGALTMLAMNACALGQTPADFIDWTDLHPTEPNTWLAWHCGNAACALCADGCKAILRKNERLGLWSDHCFGAIEFRMKEGPVTCARMMEYDGKYVMFYGVGESVDIPPISRGCYAWVKVKDLADWETKMIEAGVVHHGVLIFDEKVADALTMFCKFLDIEGIQGA